MYPTLVINRFRTENIITDSSTTQAETALKDELKVNTENTTVVSKPLEFTL